MLNVHYSAACVRAGAWAKTVFCEEARNLASLLREMIPNLGCADLTEMENELALLEACNTSLVTPWGGRGLSISRVLIGVFPLGYL